MFWNTGFGGIDILVCTRVATKVKTFFYPMFYNTGDGGIDILDFILKQIKD